MAVIIPSVTLRGCNKQMPVIGLGTCPYPPPGDPQAIKAAVIEAIKVGYRHFDTAFAYGSEKPLGEAIAEALKLGLVQNRDELFITTKLWCSFADPSQVVSACKISLQNLQLEYVDMYLIHWPLRFTEMVWKPPAPAEVVKPLDVQGVWTAMEECKSLGLTNAIGVSNFPRRLIEELLSTAKIPPSLNQVEVNPMWQQKGLIEFCGEKGIHVSGYSPLGANNTKWGDNRVLDNGVLISIAEDKKKTAAKVALRWAYQQGVSVIAKSFNNARMAENLQIFDGGWSLSAEDLDRIGRLPQRKGVRLAPMAGDHELIVKMDAEL